MATTILIDPQYHLKSVSDPHMDDVNFSPFDAGILKTDTKVVMTIDTSIAHDAITIEIAVEKGVITEIEDRITEMIETGINTETGN